MTYRKDSCKGISHPRNSILVRLVLKAVINRILRLDQRLTHTSLSFALSNWSNTLPRSGETASDARMLRVYGYGRAGGPGRIGARLEAGVSRCLLCTADAK